MKTIRFIDLFAGIGGLRIGFESAMQECGFKTKCVMTSEIKPHALEVLKSNFKHDKLFGDITQIKSNDIPTFDILLAGFPCQSFSSAGKRLGFLDTRGTLFFEVERILNSHKPYGFILENVEGLIKHDIENKTDKIGRTLNTIIENLKRLGYIVNWKLLDSKHFGVPQSRKRVFIVGTRSNEVSLDRFTNKSSTLKDILINGLPTIDSDFTRRLFSKFSPEELYGKAIKDKRGGDNNVHSWDMELKGKVSKSQKDLLELLLKERRKKHWADKKGITWMDGMPLTLDEISTFYPHNNLKELLDDLVSKKYLRFEYPKNIVLEKSFDGINRKVRKYDTSKSMGYNIVAGKLSFEFSKILNPCDIAPTIVATDISKIGILDGNGLRKITLNEGIRLFGFPTNFKMDVSIEKSFDLLGNTVVVPVVKEIAKRLGNTYSEYCVKETLTNIEYFDNINKSIILNV